MWYFIYNVLEHLNFFLNWKFFLKFDHFPFKLLMMSHYTNQIQESK